ncbi:hypothetical protein K7X08_015680 [Anisodus acutangulus]|uniref:C2 NT-type domain-containing protein n=1 Tax=Anisodus acutangulus TaxID=402998 RepID=A0A9Q1QXB2_9SOLA|nr:hypothetical protein K7X08_015680 [Anisodus acutangulus]
MFKLQKQNNKQAKSGERVDFRFSNFQALQVPKGWDRLSLSIICVETGKTVANLGKTLVKNGSCQWPETLLESVWISQDDSSSLELEESLYRFVVSMGSARSGLLGEGTINLASYVGSRMSSPVLLPLKKCNQGTTLQVKIHCLTPRSKFRDESKSSGSSTKEQGLDHDHIASKSNESDNSAGSDVLPSIYDAGSNSGPGKFEIKERSFSASGSNNSFSSAESFTRKEKLPSRNHLKKEGSDHTGKQVRASPDHTSPQNGYSIDDHSVSNRSSYNTKGTGSTENLQNNRKDSTASSQTNLGSSRNLLEAAEDTIEELRIEANIWERNARKLMLDLDILREDFSAQSKKQADLVMDLSAAYSEQGSNLKREIENLKLMLEESTAKHDVAEDSIFQPKNRNHIQEELENEIRHQQELNASLSLQLKGSQESNVELVSLLQELEETIEQQKVELEKFSSLHLRLADMQHSATANLQKPKESDETLQRSVESLTRALQDKNFELESERRMNRQTLSDIKKEYENNGHSEKASTELIRDIEALREKVQELETDCAELTRENLDLLIKFKASGSETMRGTNESIETLDSTLIPVEKFGANENSEDFTELVMQLEVAFHHLKRPWHKLSSSVSDQCKHHLDNLANLSDNSTGCVLPYLFDLNNLLETRIFECEEHFKQHKQLVQQKNNSLAEAQRNLDDYSLEVQAHESSKAELEIQRSDLLKELDQKNSELDKLYADLQTNEEEKIHLLEHQRELEGKVADLQKEKDHVDENMKIISRESAITSRCLDDLQNDHKLLERKLAQLESEKQTLEDRLVGLTEKNETTEAKIRVMTVDRESRQLELEESRSNVMNLQEEIGKLENERTMNIADLKEELEDMQILWSQAREECGHLTNENEKLQETLQNVERKNVEQHEHRVHLEAQQHELQKSLSNSLIKVKALEANLNSMWKDFSLKEEKMNAELNELIQENKNEIEKLVQEDSLSNQKYSEKLTEVDSLKKEVEQLTKQMVDHAKISKLLPNYRANEEKFKTAINDLELQLTLSRYEHQKLHEESANLKFQLQKTKELQDEVFNLKSKLTECMSEKGKLEASLELISKDCEEMKAEKASFAGKISELQKVLSELENSNRKRVFLEEKVEQMESDLTEKEKFCAHVADLKNDISETRRENEQYKLKIYKVEEEKDNCLRKVHALEAEVKMMEEEKKLYAKKFEQNDTPKSNSKYSNFNRTPQKLSQSQELLVDRFHSDRKCSESEGENDFTGEIASSIEMDYLARIQLLENKLAEALEANKKYKIQLQRFKTDERKGHTPSSKKSDMDNEMVKRFKHTKNLLETELKDIRERYFQMSLKYAEVEAQREDLVMKLKTVKTGKRWFS